MYLLIRRPSVIHRTSRRIPRAWRRDSVSRQIPRTGFASRKSFVVDSGAISRMRALPGGSGSSSEFFRVPRDKPRFPGPPAVGRVERVFASETANDLGVNLRWHARSPERMLRPPSEPFVGRPCSGGRSRDHSNGPGSRHARQVVEGVPVPFPSFRQGITELGRQLAVPLPQLTPSAGRRPLEPRRELDHDLVASHPTEFSQERSRVGDELNDVRHERRVHRLVGKRQVLDVTPHEGRNPLVARPSHHSEGEVDPDDFEPAGAQRTRESSCPHSGVEDGPASDKEVGKRLEFRRGRGSSSLVVDRGDPVELDVPMHVPAEDSRRLIVLRVAGDRRHTMPAAARSTERTLARRCLGSRVLFRTIPR